MSKYGLAAVEAVRLYTGGLAKSPRDAWEEATSKLFGLRTSSQCKGCPRDAFLGLCGEGLVEGIEPGNYTRSRANKGYALEAVAILKQGPSLSSDPNRLWAAALKGESKKHNGQMDVVVAMWDNGLIHAK